jgi:acetyl esterase/lipase
VKIQTIKHVFRTGAHSYFSVWHPQSLRLLPPSIRICFLTVATVFTMAVASAQKLNNDDITPGTTAPLCTTSAPRTFTYVPFGTNAQTLDLYLPTTGSAPFPTVIWIHGGGWVMGDKADVASAKRLVCKGYAVASINYRLSGVAKFPAQIYDVKAAIRYLRANASTYALDATRFATFGSSAGGHLSSFIGSLGSIAGVEDLTQGNANVSSSVKAAIAWYGPSDFSQMDAQALAQGCGAGAATHGGNGSPESGLVGCTVSDPACANAVSGANPANFVQGLSVPMLFMHGSQDCTVPVGQSLLMRTQRDSRGIPGTFKRIVLGAGHGGLAWETSPVQDAVSEFLDVMLKRPIKNDLSGDGNTDLIFRDNSDGQIGAWLMSGSFVSASGGLVPAGNLAITHTGDFNGDSKTDILYRNDDGAVTLHLMSDLYQLGSVGLLGPDPNWRVSHVGDFNGDGKADILWRNSNGAVTLWLMDGTAVTGSAGLLGADPDWRVSHVADFNNDGKADILWRHTNGATTIWLMNGSTIASATGILGSDANWRVSHVADFDGDGKADLLWRNSNGAVTTWLMNGTTVANAAGILGPNPDWSVTHTGDFNGDGKADILWRNTNGAVTQWLMSGTTVASATGLLGADPNWRVTHLGDYNGDGKADLLWRNTTNGSMTMWLVNGTAVIEKTGILGPNTWSVVPPAP